MSEIPNVQLQLLPSLKPITNQPPIWHSFVIAHLTNTSFTLRQQSNTLYQQHRNKFQLPHPAPPRGPYSKLCGISSSSQPTVDANYCQNHRLANPQCSYPAIFTKSTENHLPIPTRLATSKRPPRPPHNLTYMSMLQSSTRNTTAFPNLH